MPRGSRGRPFGSYPRKAVKPCPGGGLWHYSDATTTARSTSFSAAWAAHLYYHVVPESSIFHRATHLKDRAKIASLRIFVAGSIFGCGRVLRRSRFAPMFHGNIAAASMTYKDSASPIQRRHLTTVSVSD